MLKTKLTRQAIGRLRAYSCSVITFRSLRINSDKGKIALWFGIFLTGFIVIGLAITIGISNQINENFVAALWKNEGQYVVETELNLDKNDYYIVASVRGNSKRSHIISTVVEIQGNNGQRSTILEAGDFRTVDCEGIGQCKEQILKGFSVEENGAYKLNIDEFSTIDQVEILSLSLHSNHSIFFQALFVLTGIALLILGILKVVFNLGKIGYNKLLQRIKKSFALFSR